MASGLYFLTAVPADAEDYPNEPTVVRLVRLVIEPAEVEINQSVTIRAQFEKTGDRELMYRASLSVNNLAVKTEEIYYFQTRF